MGGEITERPILFNAEMVHATLDDRKGQTRRTRDLDHVNLNPGTWRVSDGDRAFAQHTGEWIFRRRRVGKDYESYRVRCPYGKPGDRLWVRQSFWQRGEWNACEPERLTWMWNLPTKDRDFGLCQNQVDFYTSVTPPDGDTDWKNAQIGESCWRKRPSIHMPRWASRITLEVTGVRVERVQDISNEDAIAEGINQSTDEELAAAGVDWRLSPRRSFMILWDSINGTKRTTKGTTHIRHSWTCNPWVWVIEFQRVEVSA